MFHVSCFMFYEKYEHTKKKNKEGISNSKGRLVNEVSFGFKQDSRKRRD